MGFRDPTQMRTAAFSDSGHFSGTPTSEVDQSNARISRAISLLPGKMLSRSAVEFIQSSERFGRRYDPRTVQEGDVGLFGEAVAWLDEENLFDPHGRAPVRHGLR
jgi:hypothetical protein